MPSVIAFHTLHDANVCVCRDGTLLAVLELERLYGKRYYCSPSSKTLFTEEWKQAIDIITNYTGISTFDLAITSWAFSSHRNVLQTLVQAKRWLTNNHHNCHASIGFYDSPFNSALIVSYDGGGNDGTFNIYHGLRDQGVQLIEKVKLNLGHAYRFPATAMSEIMDGHYDPEPDDNTSFVKFAPLALSGKVMGYAALGSVRKEWLSAFFDYYQCDGLHPRAALSTLGENMGENFEPNTMDNDTARDVAATNQHTFTQTVLAQVTKFLGIFESSDRRVDGIVMSGGCALNVITNQKVVEKFGLPVHVAPAPNDCGISVGAAWSLEAPTVRRPIFYAGLPLFDANSLEATAERRNATRVTVQEVATLLVNGAVMGIVRGRQEFGPRALGHRSLVCYPNRAALKEEINRLKSREWFRPLCPSVTERSATRMFQGRESSNELQRSCSQDLYEKNTELEYSRGPVIPAEGSDLCLPTDRNSPRDWLAVSPCMSFAPPLTEEAQKLFPAITHYDGTARLQTVSRDSEPWFYSLLEEVGKQADDGGYEILMNTSFNIKGKPILNHLSTALDILDSSPEGTLTHVLVEEWLFTPQMKENPGNAATK